MFCGETLRKARKYEEQARREDELAQIRREEQRARLVSAAQRRKAEEERAAQEERARQEELERRAQEVEERAAQLRAKWQAGPAMTVRARGMGAMCLGCWRILVHGIVERGR